MLIPVKPARSLVRSSHRNSDEDEADVHVEVIQPKGAAASKIGRARPSGRTAIMNRKAP